MRGKKKYATVPRRIEIDVPVRQIACGGLHTAAVTDTGSVYTWGDARALQLGYQPHGFTNQPTPHVVEALEGSVFVTQVACGQSHTVALTSKGCLISWGLSRSGQGGHGDRQAIKVPKKITTQPGLRFVDISCGDRHTVALTNNGRCYSFGCGEHGQLGHGDDSDKLKPTLIEGLEDVNITSVVCGSIHSCFVSDAGELYVCGFGEHFYPNENQNFFYTPSKIPFKEKVVQVACGQSHIIVLDDKGDVYAWGSGLYGQLGHGVKGSLNAPRLVLAGKSIAQVAAGRYHSLALTSFGVLYSWGCGENGQLGHHSDDNVLFPKVIEPNIGTVVGQIACGEHHTAVLTSTPWNRVDGEIAEWLHAEKEEYQFKKRYLKKTNHGLFKKDLMKIQETMEEVKRQWAEEKQAQEEADEDEKLRDIASVSTRQGLMTEILQEMGKEDNSWMLTGEGDGEREGPNELPSSETKDDRKTRKKGAFLRVEKKTKAQRLGSQTARPGSAQSDTRGADTIPTLGSMTERRPAGEQGGTSRAVFLKESSAMVARMKEVIMHTGDSSNENRLKKMLALVFDFRKEYDSLKAETNKKIAQLMESKQQAKALRRSNDSIADRKGDHESRLKALEMKLNTVTIKITETEENRKNYALNIAHLKEEELERYYQLEALRKQCGENDAFSKKMEELKLQSLEEKDRSENELNAFQLEIKQFQSFIADQLGKFQSISNVARQRREKREQEKDMRSFKVREKIAGRILKLNNEMDEKNREANAMAQQLESVNERLRYFEKRFQQIASATGLTNPDAIINKFALKEEIKLELNMEIENKKQAMKELQVFHERLVGDLSDSKETFVNSKWKDVDDLQARLAESDARKRRVCLTFIFLSLIHVPLTNFRKKV